MIRHLIHVGFAKAGSTYLRRWFAAHPQLHYRAGGIAGFSSALDLMLHGVGAACRPRYFVTSSESLTIPRLDTGVPHAIPAGGNAFSGTLAHAQERACANLARLFPDAHVLIVTRGFRSIMLSSYSQYVRRGGTAGIDALFARGGGLQWQYDRIVALYRRAFGERVIVLPYELLVDDPAAFRDEIERRLGLDAFDFAPGRDNIALSPRELAWYPRLAWMAQRLPAGARARVHRRLAAASFENRLAKPIALLDRLRPVPPVTAASIPESALAVHRDHAVALAAEPLFRSYAAEYLAGEA